MIESKQRLSNQPKNLAKEKLRLISERDIALSKNDFRQVTELNQKIEDIDSQLNESKMPAEDERLEIFKKVNERNRKMNIVEEKSREVRRKSPTRTPKNNGQTMESVLGIKFADFGSISDILDSIDLSVLYCP
jgi:hypothetical protein